MKYLVTMCASMDDMPVRLFDSLEEAESFCNANPVQFRYVCNGDADDGVDVYSFTPVVEAALAVMDRDMTRPLFYQIWTFDEYGMLVATKQLADFDA